MIDKIVLGTMEFGRRLNKSQCAEMLERFAQKGFHEIDTASLYANGLTEQIIGEHQTIIKQMGLNIATKVHPNWNEAAFSHDMLQKQFLNSLECLQQDQIDMLYLHWPSQVDPLEDTLSAIDDLYRKNKFKRFAISNYPAWQVSKIWSLCDKNDWVKPSVYQGMYNMLTR